MSTDWLLIQELVPINSIDLINKFIGAGSRGQGESAPLSGILFAPLPPLDHLCLPPSLTIFASLPGTWI